jgi:hypothetical protein
MSSLTSSLLGKNRKPVQEFTGAGAVPTSDGAGPALNVKPKPQLRPKDPRDKKKLKEGDDDSIIPDDAEEVASTGSAPVPTEIGAAETGLTGVSGEKEGGLETNPNLLSASLALVAPDCTPNWDRMLSPSALPKSEKPPVSSPAPEAPAASQPASTNGPASALDALKLARPGTGGSNQSLESQAKNLVASVIQEDSTPLGAVSGDALMAQGKPMPEHVQSNSSSSLLKRFHFGK